MLRLLSLLALVGCSPVPEDVPEDVPEGWWTTVQRRIADGEYQLRILDDGRLAFTNRAASLRAQLDEDGVRLVPRRAAADDPPWSLRVRTEGVGRAGVVRPTDTASPRVGACVGDGRVDERGACLRQAERDVHDGVVAWWRNGPTGLEQGWSVTRPPDGVGALLLDVGLEGFDAVVASDGSSAELVHGSVRLTYGGLRAWDAEGRALDASLVDLPGGVRVVVDLDGAAFPVTVDPTFGQAASVLETDQAEAGLGVSVASAGDVNGDGFDDVVVGADTYDTGNGYEYGAAFLWTGSAAGLSTTVQWQVESGQAYSRFGAAVAGVGDVNGDGFDDVMVGAPLGTESGAPDEGVVRLYAGGAGGLSASEVWSFGGPAATTRLGTSVAAAGDIDGDGFDDVIVGVPRYESGEELEGAAYVFGGSAAGLSTPDVILESDEVEAQLGTAVAGAVDVNGDGFDDVIVGAPEADEALVDEGRALVYLGSASGVSTTPAWTASAGGANTTFASAVAGGDVNGDGFDDVIVGAPAWDGVATDEGAIFVYAGSATGVDAAPAWTVASGQAAAHLGRAVAAADIDGDGVADVIGGAPDFSHGEDGEGRVLAWLGGAVWPAADATWAAEGNQAYGWFGTSVGSAGDVDADGYDDVLVGAPSFDNGDANEGRAYLFRGSASGLETLDGETVAGDQPASRFGWSVDGAGDVDGDGHDDVLVGAPDHDGGEAGEGMALLYPGSASGLSDVPTWTSEGDQIDAGHGTTVAHAGDVDGDGFADVLVGAPSYDGAEVDAGRAALYAGSATGLGTAAAWTVLGDQADAAVGAAVGAAGDVDDDGFADVLVGAPSYAASLPGEGRAWLFRGSASGLEGTAAWTVDGGQAAASLGTSVAGAGDVDGDGYDDVVVGIPDYDGGQLDEGRALVFHGGASGLATAPGAVLEPDVVERRFGYAVAGAGDVDGDGFADLAVGAPGVDGSSTEDGAFYVFSGSAAGLDPVPGYAHVSPVWDAAVGSSVASVGDIDGDGYDDLVVRSRTERPRPDVGVRLYLGSAGGIGAGTGPAWVWDSPEGWGSGWSAAGAGDVDGDGFDDVVFGGNEAIWLLYGSTGGLGSRDTGSAPTDTGDTGTPTTGPTGDTGIVTPPGDTTDTGSPTDPPDEEPPEDDKGGCGCASGPSQGTGAAILLALVLAARRR